MTPTILVDADNDDILDLIDRASVGMTTAFRADRRPNAFSLCRVLGATTTYGVRHSGRLVAMMSVSQQLRYMNGVPTDTYYLHDVRSARDAVSGFGLARLFRSIGEEYRSRTDWMFAQAFSDNPWIDVLSRQRPTYPPVKPLATVVHVGLPLFYGSVRPSTSVERIDGQTAWDFYRIHAAVRDFAPADPHQVLSGDGYFLGVFNGGVLQAIGKVVDQSHARRIVRTGEHTLSLRLLDGYCRLRRRSGVPDVGAAFPHVHLAYRVTAEECDADACTQAFVAWLRRHVRRQYTYVFASMLPHRTPRRLMPGVLRYQSHVVSYGVAPHRPYNFPEITLM